MKLSRLTIHKLPGIISSFTLTTDPAITIITGPNASGKSSILRALRYLLAPQKNDPKELVLEAHFGDIVVHRTASEIVWKECGRAIPPPNLPSSEAIRSYWLTIENLLAISDSNTEQLIKELSKELAGGYDLPALKESEPFKCAPKLGQNESKNLRKAEQRKRRIEEEYKRLKQKERDELPKLEAKIHSAQRAEQKARDLEKALELEKNRSRRLQIQAQCTTFPKDMDALDGKELERLETLEKRQEKLKDALNREKDRAEAAHKQLHATHLAHTRPTEDELDTFKQKRNNAENHEQQLREKNKQRTNAQKKMQRALTALGGNTEPPQLTPEQITKAETFACTLYSAERNIEATQARIEACVGPPNKELLSKYKSAIEALTKRLAVRPAIQTGAGIALFGGVLTVGISFYIPSQPILLGGLISSGLLAVGGSALILTRCSSSSLHEAQRTLQQLGEELPSNRSYAALCSFVEALEEKYSILQKHYERALRNERDKAHLATLKKSHSELLLEKKQLADELGFDPQLFSAASIDHFVRHVQNYHSALQELEEIDTEIEQLEQIIRDTYDEVRTFLQAWDRETTLLNSELTTLAKQTGEAQNAEKILEQANAAIQGIERDLTEVTEEIKSLYRGAKRVPGERKTLANDLELRDQWQELQKRLHEQEGWENACREALKHNETLIKRAENGEREALEQELSEALECAKEFEECTKQRSELQSELKQAGVDERLEQANIELSGYHTKLERCLESQLFAEAAQFLLEEIEEEHHTNNQPEVLNQAREYFARFTHYAWDIELTKEELRARDLQQNALRSLSELSSGTRMQLLIALRISWIERLEKQTLPLPLFLDEALSSCDEERLRAVMQCLSTLASEKQRQIVYLSARRNEPMLWETIVGKRPYHIDLAKPDCDHKPTDPSDYKLTFKRSIPAPEEKSAEEYAAELNVALPNPMHPPDSLHIFHLLRDALPLLHTLMQNWKVTTLAQLEKLLEATPEETPLPDTEQRARIIERCHIARAWHRQRKRSLNLPIDRSVLEKSKAVSGRFIKPVTALSDELGGDPQALLEALHNKKVPYFRQKDQLEEYLREEGYLREVPPHTERELLKAIASETSAQPEEIAKIVHWLESCATTNKSAITTTSS